jgi:ABC-type hemin transport system ATPase subunit
MMKDGRVMADGGPNDVLTPENLEKAFGVKAIVKRAEAGHVLVEVGGLANLSSRQR